MTASVAGVLFFLERVSAADDVFVAVSVFIQATSAETTYIVLGCLVEPQPVCLFECLGDSVECGVIFHGSDIRTEIILVHRAELFQHKKSPQLRLEKNEFASFERLWYYSIPG